MTTLLAYPCIGGPLAGEYATAQDFYGGSRFLSSNPDDGLGSGRHAHYAGEYTPYEWPAFTGPYDAGDFPPKRVYLHQSVLKPTLKAGDR